MHLFPVPVLLRIFFSISKIIVMVVMVAVVLKANKAIRIWGLGYSLTDHIIVRPFDFSPCKTVHNIFLTNSSCGKVLGPLQRKCTPMI